MRRVFFLLLLGSFFYIPFAIQKITLGFHPSKLHPHLSYKPEWEGVPLTEEIRQILDQPFTYFNLGSQSYVFLSQDQKYVLKLFRYNRSQFGLIEQTKQHFRKRHKATFLEKIDKTFQACALACREAQDWTQLLFISLNLIPQELPTIDLTDPMGRHWKLPLNQYRFALQRKAEPFKKTLEEVFHSNRTEEMKHLLDSFILLLYERSGKCIRNSDPNYGPNFGFYHQRAVEIDCGNYRKCPELKDPDKRIQEMDRFIVQLYQWIIKHAQEYEYYFYRRFSSAYADIKAGKEISFPAMEL